MKKFYTPVLLLAVLLVSGFSSFAQKSYFSDVSENSIQPNNIKRVIIPQKFRTLALEKSAMTNFLWSLPKEAQVMGRRNQAPVLELPMPDGRTAKFHVWESSIMEPGLEAKFPEMKTFAGQGIDDPYATIRFDYNPYFGFHAQILSIASGTIYLDPYARGNTENYISYYKKDLQRNPGNYCETVEESLAKFPDPGTGNIVPVGNCRGTQLYTYRLALACTGEYAVAVCSPNPPTIAATAAAILTTVNRVDGVYETETSIRMVLVANNNDLIYLDGSSDPYTNASGTAMLGENQANINTVIGSANYDIGHVVSTGGGGVATLRSPCNNGSKARGVTGLPNPVGDAFDIDFVAHEMGHQWGGNHPFNGLNGNCSGGNRNAGTAYEVGSGTTIQAYAGICGSDNIQPNSDPYFHSVSFDEISVFVEAGGAACRVVTATGNTIPQITSMSNNGVSIPISTPFTLSATATDADGDNITYNWEEWDLGPATTWNGGNANTTSPLFKSRIPKVSGNRTFPDITVIQQNYPVNPAATMGGLKGETLPTSARPMKFRLTVRDNRTGGGGVTTGGDGCQTGFTTPFVVNVVGTAPFTVTVPNGGESYEGSTSQTVTWNVSGTNAAPINTATVKISLSTDGGLTYPTVLLASTANDGSEAVSIPNTVTTTARIKVEAIGNIFFDVSNANFTITAATSGFDFSSPVATTISCNAVATADVSLATTSIGGYVVPVLLSATAGVPAGTTVSFNPASVVPGNSSIVTLNNTNTLAAGTYNITITGISGAITKTRVITFIVSPGAAPTIATGPAAIAVCAGSNAVFTVITSGAAVTSYQWQLSTDGGTNFNNITGATLASYTVTGTTVLQNNYQYRVIVNGQCGSATSTAATLTVQSAPAITAHPQNVVECVGNNAVFSVTATGTGLSYQWQESTDLGVSYNNIGGATSSTYTLTGVILTQNNYRYRVIVSGTCPVPVTSNAAMLSVGNAAAIGTQPSSSIVCVGQTATFTVIASGSSLTYQWQQSTDGGANFNDITGATTATLSLPAVAFTSNGYQYRVNVFSCIPTPITSSVATLTVNTLAAINTDPASVVLCEGSSATFSVSATGTGITYQWQLSTTGCAGVFANIAGATSNSLVVANVIASQNGYAYRVVVTGACNTVTSTCAALTVNNPIVVISQPSSTSACLPTQTTASFAVSVTGTAATYQWQLSTNGGTSWTDITGATLPTLSLTGLTASMTGNQYRVVLNGTCTTNLNSSAATLVVNTLVDITSQPVAKSICAGASTTFNVAATGSTITYQWQVSVNAGPFVNISNAAPYAGVTTATLAISNAGTILNGYRYRVIVAGVPCGSVISNTVMLTVNSLPTAVLVAAEYNRLTPYINSGLYTTVSPPGNYTYQWFKNGFQVSGATTSSIPVNVDGFGEYAVIATDANGCSATTNKVSISDSVSNMIFVYPNPSSGIFQVRYYSPNSTGTGYTVNVYDSKGARVFTKQYPIANTYQKMEVNLGNAPAGTYMLEIIDANKKRLASSSVVIAR